MCPADCAESIADSLVCCGSPVMKNMSRREQPLENAFCTVLSMASLV